MTREGLRWDVKHVAAPSRANRQPTGLAGTSLSHAGGGRMKPMFKHDDFEFGYRIAAGQRRARVRRRRRGARDRPTGSRTVTPTPGCASGQRRPRSTRRRRRPRRTPDIPSAPGGTTCARPITTRPALYLITHSSAPERQGEIWTRLARRGTGGRPAAGPGRAVQIPYEDTTLPGYFFRAPDAEPGERRPLVVMNNGSDGATSHLGFVRRLRRPATAVITGWRSTGPGSRPRCLSRGIPFRHDWEAVLIPVMDEMIRRARRRRDRRRR